MTTGTPGAAGVGEPVTEGRECHIHGLKGPQCGIHGQRVTTRRRTRARVRDRTTGPRRVVVRPTRDGGGLTNVITIYRMLYKSAEE